MNSTSDSCSRGVEQDFMAIADPSQKRGIDVFTGPYSGRQPTHITVDTKCVTGKFERTATSLLDVHKLALYIRNVE